MRAVKKSPRERLVHWVRELERLEEEKAAATQALREKFESAKWDGFDTGTLRVVLKLRKMSPEQRQERRVLEAIYMAALGMLEGDPLPDEARRRLDENESPKPAPAPAPEGEPETEPAGQAPAPPQLTLPLKNPEEARREGRDAAAAGKRIYDNPFPAGDPCRAAWDEGWCEQKKSHGMDPPAAYQRRSAKPPEEGEDKKHKDAGDSEKKGAA